MASWFLLILMIFVVISLVLGKSTAAQAGTFFLVAAIAEKMGVIYG
ncbi:hypothetical protein ACWA5Z_06630 [Testudinibacter sp. P80/BLE/0925]